MRSSEGKVLPPAWKVVSINWRLDVLREMDGYLNAQAHKSGSYEVQGRSAFVNHVVEEYLRRRKARHAR